MGRSEVQAERLSPVLSVDPIGIGIEWKCSCRVTRGTLWHYTLSGTAVRVTIHHLRTPRDRDVEEPSPPQPRRVLEEVAHVSYTLPAIFPALPK
jgi:hypothetical protein